MTIFWGGNYPGAIAQGWICPEVIFWGAVFLGEHCGMGNCPGGICFGCYCLGTIFFQVVSPSDTFTTFNMIFNCSLPVLIYECFQASSEDIFYSPSLLKLNEWSENKKTITAMIHWSVSYLSISHIFYVNIIKYEGRNVNILLITRKPLFKGVLQNRYPVSRL